VQQSQAGASTAHVRALRRLALRRLGWQREHDEPEQLIPNERIIALADGTHVRQMRSSWANLLREAGCIYAQGKTPHVNTNLRPPIPETILVKTQITDT